MRGGPAPEISPAERRARRQRLAIIVAVFLAVAVVWGGWAVLTNRALDKRTNEAKADLAIGWRALDLSHLSVAYNARATRDDMRGAVALFPQSDAARFVTAYSVDRGWEGWYEVHGGGRRRCLQIRAVPPAPNQVTFASRNC